MQKNKSARHLTAKHNKSFVHEPPKARASRGPREAVRPFRDIELENIMSPFWAWRLPAR